MERFAVMLLIAIMLFGCTVPSRTWNESTTSTVSGNVSVNDTPPFIDGSNPLKNRPPVVSLTSGNLTGYAPFQPSPIYYSCDDEDGNLDYCQLLSDGVVIKDSRTAADMSLDSSEWPTFTTAGKHTLEFRAVDKEGETASSSIVFTVTSTGDQGSGGVTQIPMGMRSLYGGNLAWPVGCELGVNCSISNYPDLDKDGRASCGNTYEGHEGTDIAVNWDQMDKGMDVYAAADGVVQWVFDGRYDRCTSFGPDAVITNPDCAPPSEDMYPGGISGYQVCTDLGPYCSAQKRIEKGWTQCYFCFWGGNVVVIRHPDNPYVFVTRYDHFRTGSITVRPGDTVTAGQKIGQVGSAGRSSGPHLHFEVWSDWYAPLDPWTTSCTPQ
ncbi:Peptidase family M23 [uncultured archaeon]|nr:Peptidase family M23 [uncultured archaeon]